MATIRCTNCGNEYSDCNCMPVKLKEEPVQEVVKAMRDAIKEGKSGTIIDRPGMNLSISIDKH